MPVNSPIDLRSDLVTRPTPEMVEAMAVAAVEPQGFGPRENKTVRRLEQIAAEMLGKEDALFCPSCTLCNQIAINIGTTPGNTVLAMRDAHVLVSEAGAPSALSGVMMRECFAEDGTSLVETVARAIGSQTGDGRSPATMLVLENTHTRNGGTVMSIEETTEIADLCHARGALVHLDGARSFNAAAVLGTPVSKLSAPADTVSISLNKGLCAPVGAVLAGSRDTISRAASVRQRFGGGWRPAGVVAAAGIVALERMPETLAEDHSRASRLAEQIAGIPELTVTNEPVQTNIVSVSLDNAPIDSHAVVERLCEDGILALAFSSSSIRFVTHREIRDQDVSAVVRALKRIMIECRADKNGN